MSARELFIELVEGGYNIRITNKTRWEVHGNKVIIYLEKGRKLEIENEHVVVAARAYLDEEALKDFFKKEGALLRLYALVFTYEKEQIPFSQFKAKYREKTIDEIYNELKEKENKYIKKRNLSPEDLKSEMIYALISYSIKKRKISDLLTGIPEELPLNTQEIAAIIAKASEKERYKLEEMLRIY